MSVTAAQRLHSLSGQKLAAAMFSQFKGRMWKCIEHITPRHVASDNGMAFVWASLGDAFGTMENNAVDAEETETRVRESDRGRSRCAESNRDSSRLPDVSERRSEVAYLRPVSHFDAGDLEAWSREASEEDKHL